MAEQRDYKMPDIEKEQSHIREIDEKALKECIEYENKVRRLAGRNSELQS